MLSLGTSPPSGARACQADDEGAVPSLPSLKAGGNGYGNDWNHNFCSLYTLDVGVAGYTWPLDRIWDVRMEKRR